MIGVPTYFGGQLAVNCVASLLKNVPYADIRILKNDVGWLQAANSLMLGTTEDIILMNDDTFVICDIVKELRTLAYSDPAIGIVGGKALAPNQETVINYGIYIAPDGNTAHRHYGQHKDEVNEVETQRAVEGSCMFIKRKVIDKIGVFDEEYGMGYREEVDFAFRAREAGFKVVSSPTAEYVHFTSQTNSKLGIENSTYDYFMSKWGSKLKLGEV